MVLECSVPSLMMFCHDLVCSMHLNLNFEPILTIIVEHSKLNHGFWLHNLVSSQLFQHLNVATQN
jgi:hypothetical protein